MSFYKGDRCNSSASYQCKSGFLTSEINTALEKWAEPFKDDLKSEPILITYSDLSRLGYRTDYSSTHSTYHATEDTPDFVYDPEKAYWMMGELDDSSDKSSVVQYYVLEKPVYETALVRPVIYLDKCALEDGCTVEYTPDPVPDDIIDEPPAPDPDSVPDIEPDDNPQPNPEDEPTTDVTIVDVDNTLKNVSIVSMIVGVVLVIIGFVIIKINHNKEFY